MSLAFEMKTWVISKVMTYESGQNANFKNGDTTNQMGILHVLLSMLSISLLSRVHDTCGYFEVQKV